MEVAEGWRERKREKGAGRAKWLVRGCGAGRGRTQGWSEGMPCSSHVNSGARCAAEGSVGCRGRGRERGGERGGEHKVAGTLVTAHS